MYGLEKPITRTAFIKFKDYESKLQMMDTALFLFGMKLHQQVGSVAFNDADFSNTLTVTSPYFISKTLQEVNNIVNEVLLLSGFTDELLEIGVLKDIENFDLS